MANHVHATLKDFLSLQPVDLRTAATIEDLLRRNWRRYRLGFRDEDDELRWAEKALAQLRAFVSSQELGIQPIVLEEMMEAEISNGLLLRCRIDRVDKESDGGLHIIDYKTGTPPAKVDWEQLQLDALILSKHLPWPTGKASYLYLDGSVMHSTVLSADDLRETLWRVLGTARQIRQEKLFHPNPARWCGHCDFTSICPGRSSAEPLAAASEQLTFWEDE